MSALVQQTDEWLELRKNKIGASDAPIIMGVSPWKTELQLWEEKVGIRNSPTTYVMERGHRLEPAARQRLQDETGIEFFPKVVFHPKIDWMMASLDCIDEKSQTIGEIKCPGKEDHALAKSGKIPDKYYPQLQHQMEVCGLDVALYFSYYVSPENEIDTQLVECRRNTQYLKSMMEKEDRFINQYVQNFIAPPETERDLELRSDETWKSLASEWLHIRKSILQLERFEKREKELRDLLVHASNGKNCVGGGIKLTRSVRKGNIDYPKITDTLGIDVEPYRKEPVECWRIAKA